MSELPKNDLCHFMQYQTVSNPMAIVFLVLLTTFLYSFSSEKCISSCGILGSVAILPVLGYILANGKKCTL